MDTKICAKCKDLLPLSEFNWRNKAKGTRYSRCKVCWNDDNKERYRKNRQYYLDKISKRKARLKEESVRYVIEYFKEHPCVDCGETDPIVLSFDHMRDKSWNISQMISSGYKWESIREEIRKCEVRCMNCHTRKTAKDQNFTIVRILQEAPMVQKDRTQLCGS